MEYTFLVDTYASERLKTLSVWAMFDDADLDVRPHPNLARDRTFHEHMSGDEIAQLRSDRVV